MSTVQQRVREVLAGNFDCKSEYWSGRGGQSIIRFHALQPSAGVVQLLSEVFETWKMVRQDDQGRGDTVHHFIVRSKSGIIRGVVAYTEGSTIMDVTTRFNDDLDVLHKYNQNYLAYPGSTMKVVSYEKISQG